MHAVEVWADCPLPVSVVATGATKDPEIVTVSNDGGLTKIPAYVEFNITTTPATPVFYDFGGTQLTGYTIVPDSGDDWEKEKVCREVVVSGTGYTIGDEVIMFVYTDTSNQTGANSYELYYNVTTGAYFTPANRTDLGACEDASSSYECIEMCDDVNGDGSVINTYVDVYEVKVSNGVLTSMFVNSYTDNTFQTVYTVTNAENCSTLGNAAECKQGRVVLSGSGNRSPPPLTKRYSIKVVGAGATFLDSFSTTTNMFDGEEVEYVCDGELIDTTPTVTSTGADIYITYTSL